jgi:phosphate:Na+ symporter
VLSALGGLGLLMLGLRLLGRSLEGLVSGPARQLLTWATASVARSWLAGLVGGALTLNSSALGFSAMGLVRSGITHFRAALVLGLAAKAGATLALQLAATPLSHWALPLIGLGYLGSLPVRWRPWGELVMGLGLLLLGLSLMVEGMLPLTDSEFFRLLRDSLEGNGLGVWLLGFALAVLLGSANAVAALALALVSAGGLSLPAGLALMLGGGGGSGSLFVLGSWGAEPAVRRVALAHLLWKMLTSLVLLALLPLVPPVLGWSPTAVLVQAHSAYHLLASGLVWPFLGMLERGMRRILPDLKRDLAPRYLSQEALGSQTLAASLALREIGRMGDQIMEMLAEAERFLAHGQGDAAEVARLEDKVDQLARATVLYLGQISSRYTSEQPLRLMRAASEIEHLGDQVRRLLRQQAKLYDQHLDFSREGRAELAGVIQRLTRRLEQALAALATGNEALAREVLAERSQMETHVVGLRRLHLGRLEEGRVESQATTLTHLGLLILLDEMDQGIERLAGLSLELQTLR